MMHALVAEADRNRILVPVRRAAWLGGDMGAVLRAGLAEKLAGVPGLRVETHQRGILVEADEASGVLLEAVQRAVRGMEASVQQAYPSFHRALGPVAAGGFEVPMPPVEAAPPPPRPGNWRPKRHGEARRNTILEALRERPGLHFNGLAETTGIAAGTLRHHLGVLFRRGLAWSLECNDRCLHFAGAMPATAQEAHAQWQAILDLAYVQLATDALAAPSQSKILDQHEPTPRSTTQHRLGRLVEWGFLSTVPQGRRLRYVAGRPVLERSGSSGWRVPSRHLGKR